VKSVTLRPGEALQFALEADDVRLGRAISPWRAWSRMGSARFQRAEAGILPAPVTNASNSP